MRNQILTHDVLAFGNFDLVLDLGDFLKIFTYVKTCDTANFLRYCD